MCGYRIEGKRENLYQAIPKQDFSWIEDLTKTRPAGLEAGTYGLEIRCSKNTSPDKTKTCETSKTPLTPQLTPESRKEGEVDTQNLPAELAEIVAAWPELPEHIRQAIKFLIKA